MCSQLLVGFHSQIISAFENAEFRLIVMFNLYGIFSCISILKSCKPTLHCSLDDRADFVPFACLPCVELDND